MFGLFTLLIISMTCGGVFHKDSKDFGYCVVFPLGEFEGGELCFPTLGTVAKLRKGDIAVFESNSILHGNLPYFFGNCKLCMLVMHKSMYWYGRVM